MKTTSATRRKQRSRHKIRTAMRGRPRLSIFRSSKHIYAQIIDDSCGSTLAAASSSAIKELSGNKTQQAQAVGEALAKSATEKGISKVIFDRGEYRYHGRVRALAEAAREGGLDF